MIEEEINKAIRSNDEVVSHAAFHGLLGKYRELKEETDRGEERLSGKERELREAARRENDLRGQLAHLEEIAEASKNSEAALYGRMREVEELSRKEDEKHRSLLNKLEAERASFHKERLAAIEELNKERQNFEDEKARYSRDSKEKLEANTSAFVGDILANLNEKEDRLSRISFWSAIFGGVVLIFGLASLIYLSFRSDILALGQLSWPQLAYFAAKGTVIASVIGVISRYAYVFSDKYQKEALRLADKVHAIKFGQLYVETYGAAADWDRVKDAFANWHGATELPEPAATAAELGKKDLSLAQVEAAKELLEAMKPNTT